jgi:hypothetical protein
MCNVKTATGKASQPQEQVPGFDNTGTYRTENTGESGFAENGYNPSILQFFLNYFHVHDLCKDIQKVLAPVLII